MPDPPPTWLDPVREGASEQVGVSSSEGAGPTATRRRGDPASASPPSPLAARAGWRFGGWRRRRVAATRHMGGPAAAFLVVAAWSGGVGGGS